MTCTPLFLLRLKLEAHAEANNDFGVVMGPVLSQVRRVSHFSVSLKNLSVIQNPYIYKKL